METYPSELVNASSSKMEDCVKICLTSRRGRPGGQRYDSTRMRTFTIPFSYYAQGKCYAICTNTCTGIAHCLTPIPAGVLSNIRTHNLGYDQQTYQGNLILTLQMEIWKDNHFYLKKMRLIRPDGTPTSDLSDYRFDDLSITFSVPWDSEITSDWFLEERVITPSYSCLGSHPPLRLEQNFCR